MKSKCTAIASIVALALGIGVAGCDPGSDSADDARRAQTAGSEKPRDERGGMAPDVGDEGLIDDDTFGEEGIIDDQTFGDDGVIPDRQSDGDDDHHVDVDADDDDVDVDVD